MDTRSLDPADIGRAYDISTRSFGVRPPSSRGEWEQRVRTAIEEHRTVGVYDGDLLVARSSIWAFQQWWGGRVMPMAGIASVVVSPEYRGRGVGTALMQGTLERAVELGYPVSALYPATVPIYRRLGWEVAGTQHRVTIESRLLRDLRGGTVPVREATPDDAGELIAQLHEDYSVNRACGPKDDTEPEVREQLADESIFAYLAEDGYVVYGWERADLVVYQIVGRRTETLRSLWSVVGSGSSIAKNVYAYLAPDDPIHLLLGDTVAPDVQQTRWMFRCVDVAAAIACRGYATGVTVEVPVVIADAQLPHNCVTGRLSVSGGVGELLPGEREPDAVQLSANGLAALYAGTAMHTLVSAGLASGGNADTHAMLDSAFAGRPAYLLDYF